MNQTTSGAGAVNFTVATEGTCEFLAEVKGRGDQFQRLLAVNNGLGQVALRHGSLPPGPTDRARIWTSVFSLCTANISSA